MDPFTALVVIAMAVGVLWWFGRRSAGSRQAERRLRQICFGDQHRVDELIAGELARTPGITRAEAAHRAVMRYERDNR